MLQQQSRRLQIPSQETIFHCFDGVTQQQLSGPRETPGPPLTNHWPLIESNQNPFPPVRSHPISQNPKKQPPGCYFRLNGSKQLHLAIFFLPFSSLINLSTSSPPRLSTHSRGRTGKRRSGRRRRAFKGPQKRLRRRRRANHRRAGAISQLMAWSVITTTSLLWPRVGNFNISLS